VCLNWRVNDSIENSSGEPGFIDEKELLARLPISRRTLGNWKKNGVTPFIKMGFIVVRRLADATYQNIILT
jgi:hypothetical protein